MQRQHLDLNACETGMLIVLSRSGMDERNLEFGAALAHAANDWQLHEWVAKDGRLKAGIVVPQEHPEFAEREIDARAAEHETFRQVIISPRSSEPLGRRKYWPIYEAIARNNLVLGLHPAGSSGGHATSGTGWGTYYMQEHYGFGTGMVGNVVSLIIEGVFEQFPALKVAMIGIRFLMGALARLAHGQAMGAQSQGNATSQAPALRISARALLVLHAAHGRAGKRGASAGHCWLDRLGQADVFERLSALGLR